MFDYPYFNSGYSENSHCVAVVSSMVYPSQPPPLFKESDTENKHARLADTGGIKTVIVTTEHLVDGSAFYFAPEVEAFIEVQEGGEVAPQCTEVLTKVVSEVNFDAEASGAGTGVVGAADFKMGVTVHVNETTFGRLGAQPGLCSCEDSGSFAVAAGDAQVYVSGEVYRGAGKGKPLAPRSGTGMGTGGVHAENGCATQGPYGVVGYTGYTERLVVVGTFRVRGCLGYSELAVLGILTGCTHDECPGCADFSCFLAGCDANDSRCVGDIKVIEATYDVGPVSGVSPGLSVNTSDLEATASLGGATYQGFDRCLQMRKDLAYEGHVSQVSDLSQDMLTSTGLSEGDVLSTGVVEYSSVLPKQIQSLSVFLEALQTDAKEE